MWSLGIIFSQILIQKMVFNGQSSQDQLDKIFIILGKPTVADLLDMKIPKETLRWNSLLWKQYKRQFEVLFAPCDKDAVDLLAKMLQFAPSNRISALNALKHPFFDTVRMASDVT